MNCCFIKAYGTSESAHPLFHHKGAASFFILHKLKKSFINFFIVRVGEIAYNGTDWTQLLGAEKRFVYEQKNCSRTIRWTVIRA